MGNSSSRGTPKVTRGGIILRWVFLALFVAGLIFGFIAHSPVLIGIFAIGVILNLAILAKFTSQIGRD